MWVGAAPAGRWASLQALPLELPPATPLPVMFTDQTFHRSFGEPLRLDSRANSMERAGHFLERVPAPQVPSSRAILSALDRLVVSFAHLCRFATFSQPGYGLMRSRQSVCVLSAGLGHPDHAEATRALLKQIFDFADATLTLPLPSDPTPSILILMDRDRIH